jgi:hypothetical protein
MTTESIPYTPTTKARRAFTARDSAFVTLEVAGRFLICLAAIAAGLYIAARGNSHGLAILAALGCAALIYALLCPVTRREKASERIYYVRGPFGLILRLKGDEETDAAFDTHPNPFQGR